ncbi:iron-sulfur cluster-binding protein [Sneathiella sp. P13V-1]|uniref:LutB/LldF family L-lactate oxidation iron-sulfur protein n=1 Tax=Sneathiella sp. P13V-1 TaxID=2697366 RepID=UPI00187B847C|nr:LutB/LldF family L-lactate oxidation iron-sulfur protein [Sneathiella sp. P13V-1]MBE7636062.1 iron-sulfur cluster-binding protein [Sneathiella sp. P13V-1]
MQVTSRKFKENAHEAMQDENLRAALGRVKEGFTAKRAEAAADLPEFEDLRDQARDIKDHVLENLDYYLEYFEKKVIEAGGVVHWCSNAKEAKETILKICRDVDAKTVTKGKSMITEEIGLNKFLESEGIEPIETDLGEYIIQLADEPPSHIIGPAVHKTKEQVTELFHEHHQQYGYTEREEDAEKLVGEARAVLRHKYVVADVGITGANFLVAETGSTAIVTNEGNGDLTQSLPKTHIAVASIEKVIPTLEDVSTVMRVLARSATGQEMSVYTTFSTGPKRSDDIDGPENFHVVLLDGGRSEMIGTELQELLRCIRCGACMNHCPVYHAVGGHSYGWVYPGPIGAALNPQMVGIEEARHLPNASSFCGRCEEVCPVRIPIPKILRHWREKAFEQQISPKPERWGIELWGFFAKRPWAYRLMTKVAVRVLGLMGGKNGKIKSLPMNNGWTAVRDLPAPQGATFMEQWKKQEGR